MGERIERQDRLVASHEGPLVEGSATEELLPLTDDVFESHVRGRETIGVYPLARPRHRRPPAGGMHANALVSASLHPVRQGVPA